MTPVDDVGRLLVAVVAVGVGVEVMVGLGVAVDGTVGVYEGGGRVVLGTLLLSPENIHMRTVYY